MPPVKRTSSPQPRPGDTGAERYAALPLAPGIERQPARARPLPDAESIRLLAVPDSAPPYDSDAVSDGGSTVSCDRGTGPGDGGTGCRDSGTGPRDCGTGTADGARDVPAGPQPQPGRQQPGSRSSGRPEPDGSGPRRAGPPEDGAAAWPGRFAQVLAETLAGSRSQGQIVPWTSVQARRRIRQLGPTLTAGAAPRIRRVVTMRPAADVVEMTVVVGFGERVRALAVRLERDHQIRPDTAGPRWVCTAIEAA
jgi:hypothetical protein